MWNQDCQDINKKVSDYPHPDSCLPAQRIRSRSLDCADTLDLLEVQDEYRRQFLEKRAMFNHPSPPSIPSPRVPRRSRTEITQERPKYVQQRKSSSRTSDEEPLSALVRKFTSRMLNVEDKEPCVVQQDVRSNGITDLKQDASPVKVGIPRHQKPTEGSRKCPAAEPRHSITVLRSEEVAAVPFTPVHRQTALPIPPPRISSNNLLLLHGNMKHSDKSKGNISSVRPVVLEEPFHKDRNTFQDDTADSVQTQKWRPVVYKGTAILGKANETKLDPVDSMKPMTHNNRSLLDSIEPIIIKQNVQRHEGARSYTHPTPFIKVDFNKSFYDSKNPDSTMDHTNFSEPLDATDKCNFKNLKVFEDHGTSSPLISEREWKRWFIDSLETPMTNRGQSSADSYTANQGRDRSAGDQSDCTSLFPQDAKGDGWQSPVNARNFSKGLYTPQPTRRSSNFNTKLHRPEKSSGKVWMLIKKSSFSSN